MTKEKLEMMVAHLPASQEMMTETMDTIYQAAKADPAYLVIYGYALGWHRGKSYGLKNQFCFNDGSLNQNEIIRDDIKRTIMHIADGRVLKMILKMCQAGREV